MKVWLSCIPLDAVDTLLQPALLWVQDLALNGMLEREFLVGSTLDRSNC